MRYFTAFAIYILLTNSSLAQYAELRGHVYHIDGMPIEYAVVQLQQEGKILYLVESATDGAFQMKAIQPGTYLLHVSTISDRPFTEVIRLTAGQLQLRDSIVLGDSSAQLGPIEIRPNITSEPHVEITGPTMRQLPSIGLGGIVLMAPKVDNRNGTIEVGKGRSGSTQYLGDGNFGIIGPLPLATTGMESVQVIDQGVSARLGGFTGGAIAYRTAPISLNKVQSIQMQSSSPFNAFHHNLASIYLSRALITEEIDTTRRTRLILGYSLTGNYRYQKDPNPTSDGYFMATPATVNRYLESPLSSSELVGGYVPSASFVQQSDLVHTAAIPNGGRHDASAQFKVSWNPEEHIRFDLINTYNYIHRRLPIANNTVLNSDQNPQQEYHYVNSQLNFLHKLKTPYTPDGKSLRDSSDLLSSLFYSVEINHQYSQSTVSSFEHADNFFNYGYVGTYNTERLPVYTYQTDKIVEYTRADGSKAYVSNYWELSGFKDSLTSFNGSDINRELSQYTSFIYNSLGENASQSNLVQRGGLLNGQNMPLLYSLYANPGTVYGSYNKNYQQRFGITAYTEAAIHPFRNPKIQHDIEFGLSYQQDKYGSYSLNAASLWQLMPLLANQHISNLDKQNPHALIDEQGRFIDTVKYDVFVDFGSQKNFDQQLRQALIAAGHRDQNGQPITESSWIDVNALSPSTFNIQMFSADELLNNGNSYVSYSGYDYTGRKMKGKKGISSFLNDPLNRPVDGFNPITAAAWIQDKFVFRNLIMRAGFRFERYDANQAVLRDPYVIYPVKRAGEVHAMNGNSIRHPNGIQDNFVVYVNDSKNPTSIVGYRHQEQWYDANGNQISDPSLLANASSSGRIQPYLIDPDKEVLTPASFKSYKPQNIVLPRISFSFPINRNSMLFVSYDKLAQNPDPLLNYLPFTTYYFMQSNLSGVLPNPELKARLKTEYNIGYKQHLGHYASIKLTASYATIRNDFNQFRLEGAYPYSYTTYSNIDFSAVKRYIAEYEYANNHLSMSASYALQFADGTGSNINSAAALIQSGQPNLRSFFPLSYDNRHTLKGFFIYSFGRDQGKLMKYAGPTVRGKQILKDAFVSFTAQSYSGFPYSATIQSVSEAQASNGVVQRSQLRGNPFGNRLVWRHLSDLRFEKAFTMSNNLSLSAYVVVSNVFNLKIVQSVYGYTGLPDDDGYLNSPQGQQQVRNQIDVETFTTLYRLRMNNQNNFGAPRNVQLGITMNL